MPALVCVLQKDIEPHRATIGGVMNAAKKEIKKCCISDIALTPEKTGIKGSPTYVSKAFRNVSHHNAEKFNLSTDDSVKLLKEKLETLGVLKDA